MLKVIPIIECSAIVLADPDGQSVTIKDSGMGECFERYVRKIYELNSIPMKLFNNALPHLKVKLTEVDDATGKLYVDMAAWKQNCNAVKTINLPWLGYIPEIIARNISHGFDTVYTVPFNPENDSDPGAGEVEMRISLTCPSEKERDRLRASIIDQHQDIY